MLIAKNNNSINNSNLGIRDEQYALMFLFVYKYSTMYCMPSYKTNVIPKPIRPKHDLTKKRNAIDMINESIIERE